MADMSQTGRWDNLLADPAITAGAQLERRLRDNQLWLKGTDYEAQAELWTTVMIAKPETEFITQWCVMYDSERCNVSTPCIKERVPWENWSVTSERISVTSSAVSWVLRLSPELSEQWAVVAQGSRHHRLHPGADGTREHRRQHGVSQGEGGRSWGKQRQKVQKSVLTCKLSRHFIKCLKFASNWHFVTMTLSAKSGRSCWPSPTSLNVSTWCRHWRRTIMTTSSENSR